MQLTLDSWCSPNQQKKTIPHLDMPRSINWKKMKEIYEFQPKNYEELLSLQGVGPNTVRALALISDLIYGQKPSWKDPIRYTFAHGGKDNVPKPVNLPVYDNSIKFLEEAIKQAKLGDNEKHHALERLRMVIPPTPTAISIASI